jgi:hypothetical protein
MASANETRLGTVRTLIQATPDAEFGHLARSLANNAEGPAALQLIRGMIDEESVDRRARDAVFAPLLPLFGPPSENAGGLRFPSKVLAMLWRGLKLEAPRDVGLVIDLIAHSRIESIDAAPFDALCVSAAAGLRAGLDTEYAAAADALMQSNPLGAESLAVYLDLVPVARRALHRLPDWLGRINEERAATARVTFKDAVEVAEDAGPRLIEILYGHLEEPHLVLRLISAVMHRPGDRYVATSELAPFGERLMDDIDRKVQETIAFEAADGPRAGAAAASAARVASAEMTEFEETMDLSREGPWGRRIHRQKRALAQAIEARLRLVEPEAAAALPIQSSHGRSRGVPRGRPRLTDDPDPRRVERARAVLTFMHGVRASAERIGFTTAWTKTAEGLQTRLDVYVEDLLEILHERDPSSNLDRVRQYLDLAAEFLALTSDERAAQIVRRRAAAA